MHLIAGLQPDSDFMRFPSCIVSAVQTHLRLLVQPPVTWVTWIDHVDHTVVDRTRTNLWPRTRRLVCAACVEWKVACHVHEDRGQFGPLGSPARLDPKPAWCLVLAHLAPCFYKLMILQPSEEMVNRIRTLMTLGQPRCSSDHNALFKRSLTTTPPNTAWSRVGSQTVPIQPVPTSTKEMEFTNSFQGEGKDSPNEGSVLSKRRNEQ